MMLKQEKKTEHSIAFIVDMNTNIQKKMEEPQIKKRLEQENKAAAGPHITLE